MKTPRWEPNAERFMTQEEVGALLQKAHELIILGKVKKRKALVRDAMIIFTGLYSGLRRFEVANLMLKDLQIGNGRSYLIVQRGKNGKSRTVHIGKDFKKILKDYIRWKADNDELHPEAYLIRNKRSEFYTPTGLWKRWIKYAPNGHRYHDCRHTQASILYQATRDLRMVGQQLGHSSPAVTALYAKVCPEIIQEGVNEAEGLMRKARKSASKKSSNLSS